MSEEVTPRKTLAEESMSSEPASMTMRERFPHLTPEYHEELCRLGQAVYDKLKPEIEPLYDRQFITIHVDTGDYAIGKNSGKATRILRERHAWMAGSSAAKSGMNRSMERFLSC